MVVVVSHAQPWSAFLTLRQVPLTSSSSFRIRTLTPRFRSLTPRFTTQRLGSLNTRCSINTDVLTDIATDQEVRDDVATDDCGCTIPVLHLKSDILETEALNLLAKGTFVDTLLTTLPVLSEEEQNIIAATPAHPAGLYALYASCLAGYMVEQLWNFASPAAIALIHPSLLPVALMGFLAKLAVIGGGPLVGKLMDHFPRVPAYNCLYIVQTAAQLMSVGMIIHGHTLHPTSASSLLFRPWFIVLVLVGAVERLSGLALGVAVERDWVVLLAGTNRPVALAQANAVLSRINLLCEIVGAALFGILLAKYELVLVGIGSNDYINNFLMPDVYQSSHLYSPSQYATLLIQQYSQQLKELYSDGARKIALFGLPQIGCIPDQLNQHSTIFCVDSTNKAVQLFNKNLKALVDDLNTNFPDAKFIYINMYSISSAIAITLLNNPCCQISKTMPEGQCIPGKSPCLFRATHFFYDNFHPTEIGNNIATSRAYRALLPSDSYPMDIRHLVRANNVYYDDQ